MAVIVPVLNEGNTRSSHVDIWVWDNIASGDTCLPVVCGQAKGISASIQDGVIGTTSIAMHGSLDTDVSVEAGFGVLTNEAGTAVALNVLNEHSQVVPIPYRIKPIVSGAGGSGLKVIVLLRKY